MTPLDHFIEKVKGSGLKLTPQRMMIFKILAESHDHPSAEMLYRKLLEIHPTISMNTVYQTMDTLKEMGLVTQIDLDDKSARFEANMKPHHHIVCRECGKIDDVYDERLVHLEVPKELKKTYQVSGHSVTFYGICRDCQKKDQNK